MVRWSAVVVALLAVSCVADAAIDSAEPLNKAADNDDFLVKQAIWKKCHRKLTPACLKLSLVRTVEMMSKDSTFFLAPGVFFSSNLNDTSPMPADLARSLSQEHAHVDDLVSYAVSRYMRSVTLNVNLVDFFSGGNETIQNSMVDAFSGRAKHGGLGAYGGLALVSGGSLAAMMLAALAALAGKALMTSMLALMMSALAAMKGSGGGGGGEHKTYEVITKPIVSHVNTHSSEVQHEHGGHHHYRRSLAQGVVAEEADAGPYMGYALERQRTMRSANLQEVRSDPQRVFQEQDQRSFVRNPSLNAEEVRSESSEVHQEDDKRSKRSLDKNVSITKKDILDINRSILKDPQRNRRNVGENIDQEKDSSEVHYAYSELPEKDRNTGNTKKENTKPHVEISKKEKRGIDEMIEIPGFSNTMNIYNSQQEQSYETVRRKRAPILVAENPKKKSYDSKIYFPRVPQEFQRDKRNLYRYETSEEVPEEGNLNYYKPPFMYIPVSPNLRIKRNVDNADLPDSRIYHLNQDPYKYYSNNFPVRDQFTTVPRRDKRQSGDRLTLAE